MLIATAAQDYMLDTMWATSPGTTVESGLLTGDPRGTGVEVSGGGYARVPVATWASFWNPASGGVKTSIDVTFPDATDVWDTASWEGIWVDGVLWDAEPLSEDVAVVAGPGPVIAHSRQFRALPS